MKRSILCLATWLALLLMSGNAVGQTIEYAEARDTPALHARNYWVAANARVLTDSAKEAIRSGRFLPRLRAMSNPVAAGLITHENAQFAVTFAELICANHANRSLQLRCRTDENGHRAHPRVNARTCSGTPDLYALLPQDCFRPYAITLTGRTVRIPNKIEEVITPDAAPIVAPQTPIIEARGPPITPIIPPRERGTSSADEALRHQQTLERVDVLEELLQRWRIVTGAAVLLLLMALFIITVLWKRHFQLKSAHQEDVRRLEALYHTSSDELTRARDSKEEVSERASAAEYAATSMHQFATQEVLPRIQEITAERDQAHLDLLNLKNEHALCHDETSIIEELHGRLNASEIHLAEALARDEVLKREVTVLREEKAAHTARSSGRPSMVNEELLNHLADNDIKITHYENAARMREAHIGTLEQDMEDLRKSRRILETINTQTLEKLQECRQHVLELRSQNTQLNTSLKALRQEQREPTEPVALSMGNAPTKMDETLQMATRQAVPARGAIGMRFPGGNMTQPMGSVGPFRLEPDMYEGPIEDASAEYWGDVNDHVGLPSHPPSGVTRVHEATLAPPPPPPSFFRGYAALDDSSTKRISVEEIQRLAAKAQLQDPHEPSGSFFDGTPDEVAAPKKS